MKEIPNQVINPATEVYKHNEYWSNSQNKKTYHVRKPVEYLARTIAHTHIGQGREERAEDDGDVWKTRLGGASEDAGCVSGQGKPVYERIGLVDRQDLDSDPGKHLHTM